MDPLEHINRSEAALLWRQFVQTVFALDAAKCQQFIQKWPRPIDCVAFARAVFPNEPNFL